MLVTATTSPRSASKTGKSPLWVASLATRMVSQGALPQPSGHGTRTCKYRAPRNSIARRTLASRSCRSATVAVATYGISCAMAIAGAFLPWPKALPGRDPIAGVVAVRAAGGVAPERCTPVFM
jgi:hypothetical protein